MIRNAGVSATLVLAAAAMATMAAAEQPVTKPADTVQRMLERMDRNVDGKISFEEYRNAMVRRFDARDANHDGVLAGAEFPREWIAGAAAFDASGKLTLEDFGAALQPTFDRFDADHDGKLDAAEITAFAAARKAKRESTP